MPYSATLLADAAVATLAASTYAYVGQMIHKRPIENPDARLAKRAFVAWWWGLSIVTLVGALRSILGALDILDVDLHETLSVITLPAIVILIGGLVYYLTFLHTGKPTLFLPIALFHAALFVFYAFITTWRHANGVTVAPWSVSLAYEREFTPAMTLAVLVTLLGPVLFAAGAYFTLLFRTDDAVARYRIGVVSVSILAWFGSALVAATAHLSDRFAWWPLVSRLIGLAAALALIAAYRPPRWIKRKLGLRGAYG